MSRVGNVPIDIPAEVEVSIDGKLVTVKGPHGELSHEVPHCIDVEIADDQIIVTRKTDQQEHRSLHGLSRTLLANMVQGVAEPFEKRLEIQGVGYRATMEGDNLRLYVGYSHDVIIEPLEDLELTTEDNNIIIVRSVDKQKVGQMAANIRAIRPVSPYWSKGMRWRGIKYVDEQLRRKPGEQAKIGVE